MNDLNDLIGAVEHAKKAPYYRENLPEYPIQSIEDFQNLPFLNNRSYRQNTPPNNEALCSGKPTGCFVFSSGGTTSDPRYILRDFEDISDQNEYFQGLNIGPEDTAMNLFMPGIWGVFSTTNMALSQLGCRIVPQGGTRLDEEAMQQIKTLIRQFKVNCLVGMPSTIVSIADYLKDSDEVRAQINKIYCLGEKVFEVTMQKLCGVFHDAVLKSAYGCMESAAIGYQCPDKTLSDYHVFPYQYVEIIDPETGKVVPKGNDGEIIVTTLKRRLIPLVRYRTGDVGRLSDDECSCGKDSQMLHVNGRSQDMVVSASLHLSVENVSNIIIEFNECSDAFQIVIDNTNGRDAIRIKVEADTLSDDLSAKIRSKCLMEIQDLNDEIGSGRIHSFDIECLSKGSIERVRATGKIKRILDLRK